MFIFCSNLILFQVVYPTIVRYVLTIKTIGPHRVSHVGGGIKAEYIEPN